MLLFFLFSILVWASPEGYRPISEWVNTKTYFDPKSGRIVVEKKDFPALVLLKDSSYALRGKLFIGLADPVLVENGNVLLSQNAAEKIFFSLLKKEEKKSFSAKKSAAVPGPICANGAKPIRRVFLDPGHGGEDSGTKRGDVLEKEVVLSFSRKTATHLKKLGFEVSFSRTKDVFLPLDIRTKLAQEWKADVFISVHVNSSKHSSARGTETYILSQEATDAEARKLALLENSYAEKAKEKESALQDILWDMEQTLYLQESAYLASYVHEAIVEHAEKNLSQAGDRGWKNRGVRQAPFYVLNRAPMPAILVELGYLSNEGDAKLLLKESFQDNLARALAQGVKQFSDLGKCNEQK